MSTRGVTAKCEPSFVMDEAPGTPADIKVMDSNLFWKCLLWFMVVKLYRMAVIMKIQLHTCLKVLLDWKYSAVKQVNNYFNVTHTVWNFGVNTLRPRQCGHHFLDNIFKCIFLNENLWISIKISLKFVSKCKIKNIPALVKMLYLHQPGDKPLSEPMMVRSVTHICITWPQWVKVYKSISIVLCELIFYRYDEI